MNTGTKLALGLLAGAGLSYAARMSIRSRRRIELEGRVVIITGASSGLGLLLARKAARRGARVVLVARNGEALDAAANELLHEGAPEVLAVPLDITDHDDVQAMVDLVVERFGRVDVLINNAALMLVAALETMTLEEMRRVHDSNFWGAVYCTLAVLPHMEARGSGRIGNVVSIGGRIAAPHMLAYTTGKFALSGFNRGLFHELANRNIYVTGLYPSMIRTGGHANAWFKGDVQAEYAWFAAGDVNPITSASAHRMAENFLEAICNGDPEASVDLPARLVPVLDAIFPAWSSEVNALIERSLPHPKDLDQLTAPPVQGRDIPGELAETLTNMVPDEARPG